MSEYQIIEANLSRVRAELVAAADKSGRAASSIKLVAVSKRQSLEKMRIYQQICLENDLEVVFGENRVQEFRAKKSELQGIYKAHLIGPLQSNKARDALSLFDLVQSVHSVKIAECLNREAKKLGQKTRCVFAG